MYYQYSTSRFDLQKFLFVFVNTFYYNQLFRTIINELHFH